MHTTAAASATSTSSSTTAPASATSTSEVEEASDYGGTCDEKDYKDVDSDVDSDDQDSDVQDNQDEKESTSGGDDIASGDDQEGVAKELPSSTNNVECSPKKKRETKVPLIVFILNNLTMHVLMLVFNF